MYKFAVASYIDAWIEIAIHEESPEGALTVASYIEVTLPILFHPR